MFVRERMSVNVVTVTPKTTIAEAVELMKKHQIRRLPVVEGERLVGFVTDKDLSEASPSTATTLSIFEINYLLAKTRISEILRKDRPTITIHPDATLEECALLMRDNKIFGVPVVENGKLVGVITETDIFDAFIDIMGIRSPGVRIHIHVPDRPGMLADVTRIIAKHGANISHIVSDSNVDGTFSVVLRLQLDDCSEIVKELKEQGYEVISATRK
ncbi:MAG: CBS and ACT domain-containing protein [Syntrophomonadaceae bacterium]|nr:CBS and ACT domain-containing protein [Syntrophomonadaceae bacterium]